MACGSSACVVCCFAPSSLWSDWKHSCVDIAPSSVLFALSGNVRSRGCSVGRAGAGALKSDQVGWRCVSQDALLPQWPVPGSEGAGAGSQPFTQGCRGWAAGPGPCLASWATSFVAQWPGGTWAALLHLWDLPVPATLASGSLACLPEARHRVSRPPQWAWWLCGMSSSSLGSPRDASSISPGASSVVTTRRIS